MKKRTFRNTSKAKLSRMSLMGHKKGVELSINMLVIIALAVFVLFLIIGFVIGGFDFFKKLIGGVTAQNPEDIARINCQKDKISWENAGSPTILPGDRWDRALCQSRYDVDIDGDNIVGADDEDPDDEYVCSDYNIIVDC